MSPWKILGLAPSTEAVAIKRAYAKALKVTRPDQDPAGYQRLREAYEWALQWASAEAERVADSASGTEAPGFAHEDGHAQHSPAASPALDDAQTPLSPQSVMQTASEPPPLDAAAQSMAAPGASAAASESHASAPMTADAHASPAAETLQDAEAEAEPPEFIPPAELLASLHQHWQQHGDAGLLEAVPALLWRLQQIPLPLQEETCWRFAQWVAYEPSLPGPVVEPLQQHFQWGLDYRVERMLGPELGEALRQRLRALGLPRLIDPQLRRQVEPLRDLLRRRNAQPGWRALAFALSLRGRLFSVLTEVPLGQLQRLDIDPVQQGQLAQLRIRAEFGLQLLLALTLAGLAWLTGVAETSERMWVLAVGLIVVGFVGLVLTGLTARVLDVAAQAIVAAVPGLSPTGTLRCILGLLLCPVLAVAAARLPGPIATLLIFGGTVMALLLCWSSAARWRGLLLPLTLILSVALSSLLPARWPSTFGWGLALLWVLLSHLVLLHWRGVLTLYREPLALLPRGVFAWVAFALFFKGVLGLLGTLLVLLTPMTSMVQALQQGTLRVGGWLGMTLLMIALARPDSLQVTALVLLAPALFWALTAVIANLARRLAGRAAA